MQRISESVSLIAAHFRYRCQLFELPFELIFLFVFELLPLLLLLLSIRIRILYNRASESNFAVFEKRKQQQQRERQQRQQAHCIGCQVSVRVVLESSRVRVESCSVFGAWSLKCQRSFRPQALRELRKETHFPFIPLSLYNSCSLIRYELQSDGQCASYESGCTTLWLQRQGVQELHQ